jgi:hypothetical protein
MLTRLFPHSIQTTDNESHVNRKLEFEGRIADSRCTAADDATLCFCSDCLSDYVEVSSNLMQLRSFH